MLQVRDGTIIKQNYPENICLVISTQFYLHCVGANWKIQLCTNHYLFSIINWCCGENVSEFELSTSTSYRVCQHIGDGV